MNTASCSLQMNENLDKQILQTQQVVDKWRKTVNCFQKSQSPWQFAVDEICSIHEVTDILLSTSTVAHRNQSNRSSAAAFTSTDFKIFKRRPVSTRNRNHSGPDRQTRGYITPLPSYRKLMSGRVDTLCTKVCQSAKIGSQFKQFQTIHWGLVDSSDEPIGDSFSYRDTSDAFAATHNSEGPKNMRCWLQTPWCTRPILSVSW